MANVTYSVERKRPDLFVVVARNIDGWERTTGEFPTEAEADASKTFLERIARISQDGGS
jgi:hypothetical protein